MLKNPEAIAALQHTVASLTALYKAVRDGRAALKRARDSAVAGNAAAWPIQAAAI